MCNSLLKPLIQKFKSQDMSVFPIIYEEFKKLIRLYASRLGYEDAAADLNLFFVELLFSIDLSRFPSNDSIGLKRYIAVSIRNHYISVSIKETRLKNFSLSFFEEVNGYTDNLDDKILLSGAFSCLSEKQKAVLLLKYIYGYSDFEISQLLLISRQAVNGTKRRALENLREYILK